MKEKRINKRIQTRINEVRSLLSGIWSDEMMKQKTSLWRGIYLTQLMSNSVLYRAAKSVRGLTIYVEN